MWLELGLRMGTVSRSSKLRKEKLKLHQVLALKGVALLNDKL
jgi:hypothetical protein